MQDLIRETIDTTGEILLGKESQIKLALSCLFAGGHLLIEDLPGMGKTTLSLALAKVLNLSYNRIQFTSDLLPADILGISIFNKTSSSFEFHEGPIFSQLVLADEINRATPKSQSALLEAMEERQVTVDGETRLLPSPFFVIATQNPNSQTGTFALPESQLDRFLMKITLGYPDPAAEKILMMGEDRRNLLKKLNPVLQGEQLGQIQAAALLVNVSDSLINYVQRLVHYSRTAPEFAFGLSPRGALALIRCAKSWALIENRNHVVPEDVQMVLPSVVEHRVRESADFGNFGDTGHGGSALAQRLLSQVDIIG